MKMKKVINDKVSTKPMIVEPVKSEIAFPVTKKELSKKVNESTLVTTVAGDKGSKLDINA